MILAVLFREPKCLGKDLNIMITALPMKFPQKTSTETINTCTIQAYRLSEIVSVPMVRDYSVGLLFRRENP